MTYSYFLFQQSASNINLYCAVFTTLFLLLKGCDVLDNAVHFKRLLDIMSMALYYCFKLLRLFCIYKKKTVMLEVCDSMYLVVQDLVIFLKLTAYVHAEQIRVTKLTFCMYM